MGLLLKIWCQFALHTGMMQIVVVVVVVVVVVDFDDAVVVELGVVVQTCGRCLHQS